VSFPQRLCPKDVPLPFRERLQQRHQLALQRTVIARRPLADGDEQRFRHILDGKTGHD
jgi:hypothetical protein